MVTEIWWLIYAAVFFALARWGHGVKRLYVIQGCLSLCVAVMHAAFGPKGSAAIMILWGLFILHMFYAVWRDERRMQREHGDRRRALRAEDDARLLAAFQKIADTWECPHCGQHDFRVQPPVIDPIVECAECRYRIRHIG